MERKPPVITLCTGRDPIKKELEYLLAYVGSWHLAFSRANEALMRLERQTLEGVRAGELVTIVGHTGVGRSMLDTDLSSLEERIMASTRQQFDWPKMAVWGVDTEQPDRNGQKSRNTFNRGRRW